MDKIVNNPVVGKIAVYLLMAIALWGWGFNKGQESVKTATPAAHSGAQPSAEGKAK